MSSIIHKDAIELAAELQAMTYEIIGERVGVLADEAEEKIGSIIIPETSKIRPIRGTIVVLGQALVNPDAETKRKYAGVDIGKRVTFNKYLNIVQKVKRMDGSDLEIIVLHASDIYFCWRSAE